MRIHWQEIFTKKIPFTDESETLWKGVKRVIDQVRSPSTQVDQAWLQRSSELNWYPYFEMLNNLEIIDQLIKAEKEGFDAVVIGCYCDPALREARGILDIPVIGLSEASMMIAQSVGNRFACVTVWESYVPIMEKNLRLYGWEDRAIAHRPVRHFDLNWTHLIKAFKGDGKDLIQAFEEVALSCAEDGADVIIAGCGYLAPALSLCGYRHVAKTSVPVIDCVAAGLTMAEALVKLNQVTGLSPSRCKTSIYPRPPSGTLTAIRKRFGFDA